MNYKEYVQQVSFRYYQPMMHPKGFASLSKILRSFNLSLEILNTRLPVRHKEAQQKLSTLLGIQRMSTFAIAAIINEAVSRMRDEESFVNVGVWHGFTLLAGMSQNPQKTCVGIDNFSKFGGPKDEFLERFQQRKSANHFFYEMDYRAYFAEIHEGAIGCYLYDGDHSYENQLEGLRLAEPTFSKDCVIVIDDINRSAPRQATLDFIKSSDCSYEILLDQQTCIPDHPTFWNGIMVLQRVH